MKIVKFILGLLVASILVLSSASAQGVATDFNTVTLTIETALTVIGGIDVSFDVVPGVFYSVKTDGHVIPILADATETVDPLIWGIDGTTGAPVTITLTLPTRFYSVSTGTSIPISFGSADGLFDNTGSADGVTGNAFNPNVQYHDFIGVDAHADVYLGYNFAVPVNASAADDYLATFALTASTTGF